MTETILLLSAIPADLRAALEARYTLVQDTPDATHPGIRIAVTMALAGAGEAHFARLPDLGLLSSQGAGLERIDLPAAARRGIAVAYTPDVMTEDVADAAIGLMYAAARRVAEADRFVRAGRWNAERMGLGISLHRKAAGIVGLGRIGQAIARRCAGLGMDVAWTGPRAKPDQPWPYVANISALAERSNVLILATPGGAETNGMVGSVMDEGALLDALESRGIAGAGLDVFAREPGLDARFMALDNVVLAPHSASLTIETRAALVARIIDDIEAFRAGRPFVNAAA
jgi:lactate dehydrogenase-like 2-hydroxyacid dehydrogenase